MVNAGLTVTDKQFGNNPITCLRCPTCGILTTTWKFEQESEIYNIYKEYSYSSDTAWNIPEATYYSLKNIVLAMERYRKLNRWLDVGCGAGALLKVLTRLNWFAEGTELSTVAVQRLSAQGFTVYHGKLSQLNLNPSSYDVVSMIELVEHLFNPLEDLLIVSRLLRPGGILFNYYSQHCCPALPLVWCKGYLESTFSFMGIQL